MTGQELREIAVETAMQYLGSGELNGGHKKIVDTYNGLQALPGNYKVSYKDSWCAVYISVVAIRAGLTDIMPRECSCGRMIELYKKLGRWEENDAHVPKKGDIIFYDWDDDGKGDNKGWPDHVGMVTAVSGKTITVIEGNFKNAVGFRNIMIDGRYIRGFGLPDYEKKAKDYANESEGDDMTQEKFNELMDNYLKELSKKPASGWAAGAWGKACNTAGKDGNAIFDGTMPQGFVTREQLAVLFLDRLGLLE